MNMSLELTKYCQTLFFQYKLSYYATGGPYYAWATSVQSGKKQRPSAAKTRSTMDTTSTSTKY